MVVKLYVGNLGNSVSRFDLENLFSDHGTVVSSGVGLSSATGKHNGTGFVEMGSDDEAEAAIAALHGAELDGRAMSVGRDAAAKRIPPAPRPRGKSGRPPGRPRADGRQVVPVQTPVD
jgi:RNA recognition motif-containing protein